MSCVTMQVLEDGSIMFSAPVPYASVNYAQNPENPCHYIPKYEPCRLRKLELRVLKCGKVNANWTCNLTGDGVSVPICRKCNLREPPDEKSQ